MYNATSKSDVVGLYSCVRVCSHTRKPFMWGNVCVCARVCAASCWRAVCFYLFVYLISEKSEHTGIAAELESLAGGNHVGPQITKFSTERGTETLLRYC